MLFEVLFGIFNESCFKNKKVDKIKNVKKRKNVTRIKNVKNVFFTSMHSGVQVTIKCTCTYLLIQSILMLQKQSLADVFRHMGNVVRVYQVHLQQFDIMLKCSQL